METTICMEISTTKSEARLLSDLIITAANGDFSIFNMLNDNAKIRLQMIAKDIVHNIDQTEMVYILNKKIENIKELRSTTIKRLIQNKFTTIGKLIEISEDDLAKFPYFTRRRIAEIKDYLSDINLTLCNNY